MTTTDRPIPFGESALASCLDVLAQLTPDTLGLATPCAEFTVGELGDHLTRSLVLLSGIAARELTADPDLKFTETTAPLGSAAVAAWRERGIAGSVAVGRTITPARWPPTSSRSNSSCMAGISPARSAPISRRPTTSANTCSSRPRC